MIGEKPKKIPMRTCVGCRKTSPKAELFRVVNTGTEVLIDKKGNRPGRGAYFCGLEKCLEIAFKQKKLSRALRCPVDENFKYEVRDWIKMKVNEESGSKAG
jgi:uncharacterized protein